MKGQAGCCSQRPGLTVERVGFLLLGSKLLFPPPPAAHGPGNNNHNSINLNKRGLRDNAGNSTFLRLKATWRTTSTKGRGEKAQWFGVCVYRKYRQFIPFELSKHN